MRFTVVVMTCAIAWLAMAASAAAVPIYQEAPPTACPSLVAGDHSYTGGCLLNATNPAGNPLEFRALFSTMYLCDAILTARVNGNGEGAVYSQVLRSPSPPNPCTVQPQNEADGHPKPWPFEITGENSCGAGCDTMELVFSVTGPFGIIVNCHLASLELRQSSHTASQVKTQGTTHVYCENDPTNALLGTLNVNSPAPGFEVS